MHAPKRDQKSEICDTSYNYSTSNGGEAFFDNFGTKRISFTFKKYSEKLNSTSTYVY